MFTQMRLHSCRIPVRARCAKCWRTCVKIYFALSLSLQLCSVGAANFNALPCKWNSADSEKDDIKAKMAKEFSEVKENISKVKEENFHLKEVKDNLMKELNVPKSDTEEFKDGNRKEEMKVLD